MTRQSISYRIPFPAPAWYEPELVPDQEPGLPTRQCVRCGALGTHYLTCPSLRLPSGYSLRGPAMAPVVRRACGGPDHPDWPLPPQPAVAQI